MCIFRKDHSASCDRDGLELLGGGGKTSGRETGGRVRASGSAAEKK